jgi:hypothetical protein
LMDTSHIATRSLVRPQCQKTPRQQEKDGILYRAYD